MSRQHIWIPKEAFLWWILKAKPLVGLGEAQGTDTKTILVQFYGTIIAEQAN